MERLRPDGGDLILRQAQGAQHLPSEVLPDPPEAFREGRGGRIREAVLREVLGSRVFDLEGPTMYWIMKPTAGWGALLANLFKSTGDPIGPIGPLRPRLDRSREQGAHEPVEGVVPKLPTASQHLSKASALLRKSRSPPATRRAALLDGSSRASLPTVGMKSCRFRYRILVQALRGASNLNDIAGLNMERHLWEHEPTACRHTTRTNQLKMMQLVLPCALRS